jgi:hypothetical protein
MALQIANPIVVGKVEPMAKTTGLSKTAVVELALDRIPDRSDAIDPLLFKGSDFARTDIAVASP